MMHAEIGHEELRQRRPQAPSKVPQRPTCCEPRNATSIADLSGPEADDGSTQPDVMPVEGFFYVRQAVIWDCQTLPCRAAT